MKARRLFSVATAALGLLVLSQSAAVAGPLVGPFTVPDDHFLCYKGKGATGDIPKGNQVLLADQFESGNVDVKKSRALCPPADCDGAGLVDPLTHLKAYKIKNSRGEAKHTKQTAVRVFNRFGDILVDTLKEARLLASADKDPSGALIPAPDDTQHNVDYFKCYKVKVNKTGTAFPKGLTAVISDQFQADRTYVLKKPKFLCNPADHDGIEKKNEEGHLLCYKTKADKGQDKFPGALVYSADGVLRHQFVLKKEELLCVPSLKNPPDQFCGDGVANQGGEECDADDLGGCAPTEVCTTDCQCTLCGNGTIDGGEQCELATDCLGTEFCDDVCACQPKSPLGERTLSINGFSSGFFSSFLPGFAIGALEGTFVFDGGVPDGDEQAPVTLVGSTIVSVDITLGNQTLCYEFLSCTGVIDCDGGLNVDVDVERDSLAPAAGPCLTDGSNNCPDDPSSLCCSNACEGPGPNSGNPNTTLTNVGVEDSDAGAMLLSCQVRNRTVALQTDCSTVDLSSQGIETLMLTTGTHTARLLNHCAGSGAAPDELSEFITNGENFECATWSLENGDGTLALSFPTEEPSSLVTGDGGNGFVMDD